MTQAEIAFYERVGTAKDVLKFGFFNLPDPADNEVQVEIIFSGINPYDTKLRSGLRGAIAYPRVIPHNDGTGIVRALGNKVKKYKIDDRVWIYNAAQRRDHGTACSVCNLPESLLMPLPECANFELGASLGTSAITAASSLRALQCQKGDIVMITGGAGSVGIFAIQLAKFLGLLVMTTVSSKEKAELSLSMGADYVINYKTDDILEKIKTYTHGMMLDGIIDVDFGGNINWTINALKSNKVIVSYASTQNPTPVFPFYYAMSKQVTIKTISVYELEGPSRKAAVNLVQKALTRGFLTPVIHKIFALEQVAAAHLEVEKNKKIGHVLVLSQRILKSQYMISE